MTAAVLGALALGCAQPGTGDGDASPLRSAGPSPSIAPPTPAGNAGDGAPQVTGAAAEFGCLEPYTH
ncbi:hypothetical protein Ate02nite_56090 [Paractinoplanes tereljensis]|uniref:Uncharacterized protein n=1 Tax=Paractinoplanes tereljensis TaxID=571912 RepID=A0A919TV24_9ACTN|nr:hypothetical protein Ate02nite_56090 [Actinoplanes tereljensis]